MRCNNKLNTDVHTISFRECVSWYSTCCCSIYLFYLFLGIKFDKSTFPFLRTPPPPPPPDSAQCSLPPVLLLCQKSKRCGMPHIMVACIMLNKFMTIAKEYTTQATQHRVSSNNCWFLDAATAQHWSFVLTQIPVCWLFMPFIWLTVADCMFFINFFGCRWKYYRGGGGCCSRNSSTGYC